MIHQHEEQDTVFEFRAPFLGEKIAPQLQTIGISDVKIALSLKEIFSNISVAKGPAFFTKHFGKTDLSAPGKILERLFAHNLLRPKKLDEEFGSVKFEEVLHNIKEKNWKLTAFDSIFGPKSTEFVFKYCIDVQHGMFPQDFPTITPGHHLYPKKPQDFDGFPAIMLQRNVHTGHKSLDSFDVMFFASIETHIFKSVFRYRYIQTNHTLLRILS